jgi:hypothetical protein
LKQEDDFTIDLKVLGCVRLEWIKLCQNVRTTMFLVTNSTIIFKARKLLKHLFNCQQLKKDLRVCHNLFRKGKFSYDITFF